MRRDYRSKNMSAASMSRYLSLGDNNSCHLCYYKVTYIDDEYSSQI